MISFLAKVKFFSFWPKTVSGVLTEIEVIFCSHFTQHCKVNFAPFCSFGDALFVKERVSLIYSRHNYELNRKQADN